MLWEEPEMYRKINHSLIQIESNCVKNTKGAQPKSYTFLSIVSETVDDNFTLVCSGFFNYPKLNAFDVIVEC